MKLDKVQDSHGEHDCPPFGTNEHSDPVSDSRTIPVLSPETNLLRCPRFRRIHLRLGMLVQALPVLRLFHIEQTTSAAQ